MDFDWDPDKSKENEHKHGISFKAATEIWQAPNLTVERIAYSKNGEVRSATIGMAKGLIFTAIWTIREKKRRLISVRRARNGEEKTYWEKVFRD